jgi:hypothetical protein
MRSTQHSKGGPTVSFPGRRSRGQLIRLAAVVLGLVVLSTACSSASDHGSGSGAPPSAVTSSSSAPSPIAAWYTATRPKIDRVEQAITYAQWMTRHPEQQGLAAACHAVTAAVQVVTAAAQPPDPIIRADLAQEMSNFTTAAQECLATRYDAAGTSVNRGYRWAEVWIARLRSLLSAS